MKRILSLFLSLALLLTLLTAFQVGALTAHAHDADDAPEAEASAVSEQPGEEDASAEPAPVPEEAGEANTEEDNRPYYLVNGKKEYSFSAQAVRPDLSEYQLTEEQLRLPTEELVQLVVDSALFGNMYFSSVADEYGYSYHILRTEFNALPELETRTDVIQAIYARLHEARENGDEGTVHDLQALLKVPFYKKMAASGGQGAHQQATGTGNPQHTYNYAYNTENLLKDYPKLSIPGLQGYYDGKEYHAYQKDETDTVDTVETEAESDGEQVELQSFIPIYANGDDGFSYMEVSTNIRTMSGTPVPRPYEPEERAA